MIDSLYIGATGMHAQQTQIDVVANNLANVNTNGFKRSRVQFEDLLYRNQGVSSAAGGQATSQMPMGMGTAIATTGKIFTTGDLKKTGEPLDVAIKGDGFFELALPNGTSVYTRTGTFQINTDRMLINQDGIPLAGLIQFPADASNIKIDADGHVSATVPGEKKAIEIGRIELVTFVNPTGLSPAGDNLYTVTPNSGEALRSTPGENGAGTLTQGFVEASNVQLIDEMLNLVMAQRAYEINSKVVQAADEMLSISNNLRR